MMSLVLLPLMAALLQAPQQLSVTKELTLGAEAEGFSTVRWVAVARDSSLVMYAPRDEHLFRVYSPTGKFITSFSRNGEGPGELRSIPTWGWKGDTLWLGELNTRRLTLFTPDFNFLRTMRYPSRYMTRPGVGQAGEPYQGRPPVAICPDGDFLFLSWASTGHPLRSPQGMIRVGADSILERTVAGGSELIPSSCRVEYQQRATYAPFCAFQFTRASRDGKLILEVSQPMDADPRRPATFRVRLLGEQGDTLVSRTLPYRPVAITTAMKDSAIAMAAPRPEAPSEDRNEPLRVALGAARYPRSVPAVTDISLGADGTMWLLVSSDQHPGVAQWTVLERSGAVLGTVALPPRSTIQYATATAVVTIQLDRDDLPSVVKYRIGGRTR